MLGIRQADIFYNAFAISTYALRLSTHIKEVKLGLYTLLNGNKLHPNLVTYNELVEGVTMLKKIALKSSKKLILDHVSDVFQLKADFVAYPSGLITVLIHIPVETKRFKLYKYISTPIPTAKNYQFVVENDKSYLAINNEATLFTTFSDLSECLQMRDIYVCTHLTILHKSDTGVDCLFDLYNNQFAFADKTCDYRIKPSTEAAVRISDSDIFVYSPNTTTLTSKCPGLESKLYNKGAAILSLGSGCVVTTTGYCSKVITKLVNTKQSLS